PAATTLRRADLLRRQTKDPAHAPGPSSIVAGSALDVGAALGLALGFRHHRKAVALAGVLALAGIAGALAGALALAGVGGHALALRGVGRGRSRRDDGAGQEQRGGGGSQRGTGLGIQLHETVSSIDV